MVEWHLEYAVVLAVAVTLGCKGEGISCDPIGTWDLRFTPETTDSQQPACELPPITSGTLVVSRANKDPPFHGSGLWQGAALEKLVLFDDAGTWDVSAFPTGDDNLVLIFRARTAKLLEGQLMRQPKKDGRLIGCFDSFKVEGTCRRP